MNITSYYNWQGPSPRIQGLLDLFRMNIPSYSNGRRGCTTFYILYLLNGTARFKVRISNEESLIVEAQNVKVGYGKSAYGILLPLVW